MKRRTFITLLGGAAAWPLAARAQQREQMRRIGVLMSAASETDQQAGVTLFLEVLHQLGWIDGHNVRVEIRWARGDPAEATIMCPEPSFGTPEDFAHLPLATLDLTGPACGCYLSPGSRSSVNDLFGRATRLAKRSTGQVP